MPFLNFSDAVCLLKAGGILVYPTETFWAIGCNALDCYAVATLFELKRRHKDKPMPIIMGDMGQAEEYVDLKSAPAALITAFWPGPLALLLPIKKLLAPGLVNQQHKSVCRICGSADTRCLALEAGFPLVATSANLSGMEPTPDRKRLSAELLRRCVASGIQWGILDSKAKGIGIPSTIIEPEYKAGCWQLKVLREGAIGHNDFTSNKWDIAWNRQ